MTAIIATVNETGVLLYSDGATYDDDGVCRAWKQKANICLHHPSIVATRGSGYAGSVLQMLCCDKASFDEMRDELIAMMIEASERGFEAGDPVNLSVFIGGWSESDQSFDGQHIWIRGENPDELVDGSLTLTRIFEPLPHIEPWPDMAVMQQLGVIVDDAVALSTDEAMIRFMEAQRRTSHQLGPGSNITGCIVGGFVQKTQLTKDEARSAIIHRWPDHLGEKLGGLQ